MRMSSSAKKYDVFFSFSGVDVREGFLSLLFDALCRKSIRAFIDYKLPRGKDIWPSLATAIEQSHVAIVIFSQSYASSTWCLKELVKILDCRKDLALVVIPFFYNIDPSHIRKQTGIYKEAFAKHERDFEDKNTESNKQQVLSWKSALTEAANISGWVSQPHRSDIHLVESIVNDVLQKIRLLYPTELKGLVETDENCTNVEKLLLKEKCRVIGIWGMGGIGKSTIAKVLFARHFPQYDHVCFVSNSKEYSFDKLFAVLFKEEIETSNVVGSTFDMKRLGGKKVFIVLDDVDMDRSDIFEYLYREYGVLHSDSRLIITTRDRQLLEGRVDVIYEVKEWRYPESLELFCLKTFDQSYPSKGYESLSDRAVKYAGGVPLALNVLGSYFRKKKIAFWESILKKLNTYPNKGIKNVLEVSYNGLDDLEKNIFLDIAFFFKEKRKDDVIRILDACDFEATSGIEVLADKALITISDTDTIQMHDLLQQLGLEIVREECREDPGKRSRLKDNEAREVMKENKGTNAIQAITLDLSGIKNLSLHADTFTKMKALRFLKFYISRYGISEDTYLGLPATLEPFSDKLRYLEWYRYPFESLPSRFCAELLVEISMPDSKVKQLWQGTQQLHHLQTLYLRGCEELEEVPDLSKAPKLNSVDISDCISLRYLHPSLLSSDTLLHLRLTGCRKLESVKGEKHLKSLSEISVYGCLSLKEFAVSSDSIRYLYFSNLGIQTLGTQIGRMKNLRDLTIQNLSNLFELPDNIGDLSNLSLLWVDGCNVRRLPESIKNLEKLKLLSLKHCKELLCLPPLPSQLQYIWVNDCTSLVSVSCMPNNWTPYDYKIVTFENSLKLDGDSSKLIMESFHLSMMHSLLHNVASNKFEDCRLNLPGSRVACEMEYKSSESSITIQLPNPSNLLGFIFSLVISPLAGVDISEYRIRCKCHLPKGVSRYSYPQAFLTRELKSDHVCLWYDPHVCDGILEYDEKNVCFEFVVEKGKVDGSMCIKECGISPVTYSHLPSVLQGLDNLDLEMKNKLVEAFSLKIVERDLIQHITSDIDEDEEEMDEPDSDEEEMVELDSDEEKMVESRRQVELDSDNQKEIKIDSATYYRKNSRESKEKSTLTQAIPLGKENWVSDDDEVFPATKIDQVSHKMRMGGTFESSVKTIKFKESITEFPPPKQNQVSSEQTAQEKAKEKGKGKLIVDLSIKSKSTSKSTTPKLTSSVIATGHVEDDAEEESSDSEDAFDHLPSQHHAQHFAPPQTQVVTQIRKVADEPSQNISLQASSSSEGGFDDLHNTSDESQRVVEAQGTDKSFTKYSSFDLENCLQQLDEDPFAILDLLSSELSQPHDVTTILNNFRTLVFSTLLLDKLPDQSHQQQIEESLQKLDTYRREMTEEQEEGLDKFVELYNKAVKISRDKMLTEDELANVAWQKRDLYKKLEDSKPKVQQFDITISTSRSQIENLQGRQREIQEAIKKYQEENEGIEMKRSKLESLYSEQQAKKKETLESVKHISTSIVHTSKRWKELEEERLNLASAYEDLKEPFRRMKTNPPF